MYIHSVEARCWKHRQICHRNFRCGGLALNLLAEYGLLRSEYAAVGKDKMDTF